jgi:hypothetical protein
MFTHKGMCPFHVVCRFEPCSPHKLKRTNMLLKPSTLAEIPTIMPKGYMISIYLNCLRINKTAAVLLDLPKNRISLDIQDNGKIYLMIDPEGFQVVLFRKVDFTISNRQLSRFLLAKFNAKTRVVLALSEKPVSEGCYLLTLKKTL